MREHTPMRGLGITSALFLIRVEPNCVSFPRLTVLSRIDWLVICGFIADCNTYHTQRMCCKVKPLVLLNRFNVEIRQGNIIMSYPKWETFNFEIFI